MSFYESYCRNRKSKLQVICLSSTNCSEADCCCKCVFWLVACYWLIIAFIFFVVMLGLAGQYYKDGFRKLNQSSVSESEDNNESNDIISEDTAVLLEDNLINFLKLSQTNDSDDDTATDEKKNVFDFDASALKKRQFFFELLQGGSVFSKIIGVFMLVFGSFDAIINLIVICKKEPYMDLSSWCFEWYFFLFSIVLMVLEWMGLFFTKWEGNLAFILFWPIGNFLRIIGVMISLCFRTEKECPCIYYGNVDKCNCFFKVIDAISENVGGAMEDNMYFEKIMRLVIEIYDFVFSLIYILSSFDAINLSPAGYTVVVVLKLSAMEGSIIFAWRNYVFVRYYESTPDQSEEAIRENDENNYYCTIITVAPFSTFLFVMLLLMHIGTTFDVDINVLTPTIVISVIAILFYAFFFVCCAQYNLPFEETEFLRDTVEKHKKRVSDEGKGRKGGETTYTFSSSSSSSSSDIYPHVPSVPSMQIYPPQQDYFN